MDLTQKNCSGNAFSDLIPRYTVTTVSEFERTSATLRIVGRYLSPDEVTKRLRLTPSAFNRVGDLHGSGEQAWRHKEGYWELTSQNQVHSSELESHIAWLLNQLEPVGSELLDLLRLDESHWADIYCVWALNFN